MAELHDLLDQHDYNSPQVGDIRQGVIVSINTQGVIVDLGLKRDGLVPTADLNKLEPDERDALKVNDEVFIYVLNTDKPDSLVVSIHLARLNQDWIRAEELLESGVHFGHRTHKWHPKMKPYIFGARNGIYIIDLQKTIIEIQRPAGEFQTACGQGAAIEVQHAVVGEHDAHRGTGGGHDAVLPVQHRLGGHRSPGQRRSAPSSPSRAVLVDPAFPASGPAP